MNTADGVYMKRPQVAMATQAENSGWVLTHQDGTTERLTQAEFDALYMPLPPGDRLETTVVDHDEDLDEDFADEYIN